MSQYLQGNGFSPVWILRCTCRFPFSVKVLEQYSHLKSPGCGCLRETCSFSYYILWKVFWQDETVHLITFCLLWTSMWCFKCYFSLYDFLQPCISHTNALKFNYNYDLERTYMTTEMSLEISTVSIEFIASLIWAVHLPLEIFLLLS